MYHDFLPKIRFAYTCATHCIKPDLMNIFFRYQGSYSPVVETEYDDETDSNYEDYSSKTTTTNSGATRYEAGSYFDQSQSENAGSDYNQNQGSSSGATRNSGSGKEFYTTLCFAYITLSLLGLSLYL